MRDTDKTREQLVRELTDTRRRMRDLEGFKTLFKQAEETLAKIRHRLEYFLDSNPAVLYAHEMSDNYPVTFISGNVTDQLGYEPEDFFSDQAFWADHIHPDDRMRVLSDFMNLSGHGKRFYEYRFLHKNGSYRWLRDESKLIYDDNGKSVEWVGICIDITERKQMEEDIRRSEERYRMIVETAREGIWAFDADLRVIYTNRRMAEMLGYTTKTIMGRTLQDFVHESDLPQARDRIDRRRRGKTEQFEIRARRRDGSPLWVLVNVTPLLDDKGSFSGFFSMVTDISKRKEAELRLIESEELYRVAAEGSNDGIAIVRDQKHLYVNRKFLELFGYGSIEEVNGEPPFSMIHPDDRDMVRSYNLNRQSGKKVPVRYQCKGLRKDGTVIYVEISGTRTAYRGKPATLAFFRNITENRLMEDALKESEKKYRELADTALVGVFQTSVDGRIIYANDTFVRLLGFDSQEELKAVGSPATYKDPEYREAVINTLRRDGKLSHYETTLVTKTGEPIDVLLSSSLKGDLISGMVMDITESKKATEALRKSEELYRLLAQNVSDVIWTTDMNLRFTYMSPSVFRLRGYTADEAMRQTLSEVLTPSSYDLAISTVNEELAKDRVRKNSSDSRVLELEHTHKNGSTVWAEVRTTFLRDPEGRPMGIVGVSREITARKRLEAEKRAMEARILQTQKMEAIGTLAGGIAHDFNNILAGIMGFSEMLLEDAPANGNTRHKLELILKSAHRGHALVRQILTFSRQTEPEKKPVAMGAALGEVLRMLRATLPSTVEIREHILAADDTILADPTQIHQILLNLCTNAAHAMRNSGGVLEVSLTDDQPGSDRYLLDVDHRSPSYLRLAVSDTGCGMSPEVMERIFEPFFTTKGPGEGTGLGLSVVHGIVKDHKGLLSVTSSPDAGTTFHLFFPRSEVKAPARQKTGAAAPMAGRVLFVDDEEVLVELNRERLERLGFEAVVTTSSTEALNLFRRDPDSFDVVLTDYTMPRLTGADLARELIKIRPDIPIILFSGIHDPVAHEEAKKLGIREMHLKPLGKEDLAALIQRALKKGGKSRLKPPN